MDQKAGHGSISLLYRLMFCLGINWSFYTTNTNVEIGGGGGDVTDGNAALAH